MDWSDVKSEDIEKARNRATNFEAPPIPANGLVEVFESDQLISPKLAAQNYNRAPLWNLHYDTASHAHNQTRLFKSV
jgi:hypothetical protein